MINRQQKACPGYLVEVTEGFFRGAVGKVDVKQDEIAGVFVLIQTAGNNIRRLWFPSSDLRPAPDNS